MPQLSRKGDTDQPGGAIMRGAGTVFANGIPVGLHVSQITPHAEGCPVLRVGSGNSCGHSIVQGSPDIFCP